MRKKSSIRFIDDEFQVTCLNNIDQVLKQLTDK